jgi:hypothetical protein
VITVGDADSTNDSGETCELRFFANERMNAVVYTNCIRKFEVSRSLEGFALGVLELRAEDGAGLGQLHDQEVFEVWVNTQRHNKPERLAILRVEYCDLQFDDSEESLEIHGRSLTAVLADEPWEVAFEGPIEELLHSGCRDQGVKATIAGIASSMVVAYVRCPSTYGALRLLASSVDAIISDEMDEVRIESVQVARTRFSDYPAIQLGPDELKSGRLVKGRPVTKRS